MENIVNCESLLPMSSAFAKCQECDSGTGITNYMVVKTELNKGSHLFALASYFLTTTKLSSRKCDISIIRPAVLRGIYPVTGDANWLLGIVQHIFMKELPPEINSEAEKRDLITYLFNDLCRLGVLNNDSEMCDFYEIYDAFKDNSKEVILSEITRAFEEVKRKSLISFYYDLMQKAYFLMISYMPIHFELFFQMISKLSLESIKGLAEAFIQQVIKSVDIENMCYKDMTWNPNSTLDESYENCRRYLILLKEPEVKSVLTEFDEKMLVEQRTLALKISKLLKIVLRNSSIDLQRISSKSYWIFDYNR